jgi:translocation and assembly module TamB
LKRIVSTFLWLCSAALALCLATALGLGLWMHHPQSLRHALTLAQYALQRLPGEPSTLRFVGASGSLAQGGHVDDMQWQDAHTQLHITDLGIQLVPSAWIGLLGQKLRLKQVSAATVRVHYTPDDQATPRPKDWSLPYLEQMDLPLKVEQLEVDAGVLVHITGLDARYRYGPPPEGGTSSHRLQVAAVTLAQGHYQGEAQLNAHQPWAFRAQVEGTVQVETGPRSAAQAINLLAVGSVEGLLGPETSELMATASLKPGAKGLFATAPELHAQAVLHPWAPMPLQEAHFNVKRLDLSVLWPQAPRTLISGQGNAGWRKPQGPGSTEMWHLNSHITNDRHGPWSQKALPVERLQLGLTWHDQRWELHQLQALALGGRFQAQGAWSVAPPPTGQAVPWWKRLQHWEGSGLATGLQPQMLDHALPLPAIDIKVQAANAAPRQPTAFSVQANTSAGGSPAHQASLAFKGTWTPQAWRIASLQLQSSDALLQAAGGATLVTGAFDMNADLRVPGLHARAELQGDTASQGEWVVSASQLSALQQWAQKTWARWEPALAPWVGPWAMPAWLGQGQLEGRIDWRGRWSDAPLDWWKGQSTLPARFQWSSQVHAPLLKYQMATSLPPVAVNDATLTLTGQGNRVTMAQTGSAAWGPWTWDQALDGAAQLNPTLGGWSVQSVIDTWRIDLKHQSRPLRFQLTNPQPLQAQWLPPNANNPHGTFAVQPGRLQLLASKAPSQPKVTAAVHAAPATVQWDTLQWANGQWRSNGKAQGWALSWINAWLAHELSPRGPVAESGLSGELMLQAQWDVATPSAKLQVRRESGDLVWAATTANERIAAGLQESSLDLTLNNDGEVAAQLRWLSDNAGQLVADMYTRLPESGNGDAPLSGQLRLDLPKVGLWSRLAPTGWRMSGAMQAQVQLGGTVLEPAWFGNLQMRNLALRSLLDGLEFSDGQLNATLSGQHLTVEELKIRGAGGNAGGWLTGKGQVEWQKGQTMPTMELTLEAQALRLLARADRRLTLTGQLQAQLKNEELQVNGRMAADQALFLLPDESTPSLGDDVRIQGKTAQVATSRGGVPTTVKVALDLGDNFQIRGQGLSTYLQGQVELSAKSGQAGTHPQLLGQIRTVRGTYKAYGQTLEIEEGTVRFNGPYDNPALEILAIRPHPNQRVGVQITGNARQPVVRLYAEPDLPDVEKLAWLILGRPATGGGAEAVVLQQAAWALLGGRGKLSDGNFVRALGFDEFTLMGQSVDANGNTNAAAITLGKRISNQLYLSYARSLAGATGTLSIFYDISQRWTLRGQAGDESGVDLIFTHKFD